MSAVYRSTGVYHTTHDSIQNYKSSVIKSTSSICSYIYLPNFTTRITLSIYISVTPLYFLEADLLPMTSVLPWIVKETNQGGSLILFVPYRREKVCKERMKNHWQYFSGWTDWRGTTRPRGRWPLRETMSWDRTYFRLRDILGHYLKCHVLSYTYLLTYLFVYSPYRVTGPKQWLSNALEEKLLKSLPTRRSKVPPTILPSSLCCFL